MTSGEQGEFIHKITVQIAVAEDVAIEALPPLANVIDIEALGRVLESGRRDTKIVFRYYGWTIAARANGRITMTKPSTDNGPYVSRCITCSEEQRGVDLESAQDFFEIHADDGHEVEIVRDEDQASDHPEDSEGPSTE